jgi:membrane-bound lytic murein transglycosylase F
MLPIETSKFIRLFVKILSVAILFLILSGCDHESQKKNSDENLNHESAESWYNIDYPSIQIDLDQIRDRGKLIALTSYSTTSYFLYRGKAMGYEYELLKRLADHLDVVLEIKVVDNLNQIFEMLLTGEGDLISHGLTVTLERQKKLVFTEYHTKTHQALVQKKPENWRQMKVHEIEESLIRDPLELIGKTVHVRKNSSYYYRLQNLMEEIGGKINVEIVSGELETEMLIEMVADGEIDYTIADYNIAAINATYYNNLDIETAVSFNQRIAWALRPTSPELLKGINKWIEKMRKTTDYYVIYNKYFKNQKAYKKRKGSEYLSLSGGKISKYDNILKDKSKLINWDWRLLASMVYQESRFNPNEKSWAGAVGLMQIMPITAKHLGVDNLYDPENNITAGVEYLYELQDAFMNVPDSSERIKFILAAYNVGPNHVADARRLAEKYGDNENIWTDNVENWMLKKSQSKYYTDEVVQYGYCRGSEPYEYVREVLQRFEKYKLFIN